MKRESLIMVSMPNNNENKKRVLVLLLIAAAVIIFVYIRLLESPLLIIPQQKTSSLDSTFNITTLTISSNGTNSTYYAYLATTLSQEQQGYMNQTAIGDCKGMSPCIGMLFLFNKTQNLCFWMDNTEIALNQVWIAANGTVVSVYTGTPYSTATICYSGEAVLETLPSTNIPPNSIISWQ